MELHILNAPKINWNRDSDHEYRYGRNITLLYINDGVFIIIEDFHRNT